MRFTRTFIPDDSIVDLIAENYNILPVLSRFAIPLGFQSRTIGQVCKQSDIDANLFLTVVNFILTGSIDYKMAGRVSPLSLVDFLKRSHDYFIDYKFPHIRTGLVGALDRERHSDINPSIMEFYDNFVEQVRQHFDYEEHTVFPYIRALMDGERSEYSIATFRRQHEEVGERLNELKNLILRFYSTDVPNRMYDALVDIYNCEEDLNVHADIENHILIPLISRLEDRL